MNCDLYRVRIQRLSEKAEVRVQVTEKPAVMGTRVRTRVPAAG